MHLKDECKLCKLFEMDIIDNKEEFIPYKSEEDEIKLVDYIK